MVDTVVEELSRKRLGRTVKGKWRLDRLIGVGGMAAVYAATHRNGARVALKMLHATISASSSVRARFVREGYLANKVDHPGVVRVLDDDVDDSDGAAFLVMDLIEGLTLADRAMQRLLEDGEVLAVAAQVLSVLVAAHAQGIVHRDLKPDNLLVDAQGKVHVLDFGIARLLDNTGWSAATKTGTAFGTPGFMAPEQAMGKTQLVCAQTDLYALGATLFALVCGDFVHAAENPQELMVLVATQQPRSLGELAPYMHPDVVAIVDKATQTQLADRWASASEMLAAVEATRGRLGLGGVRLMPVDASEPPRPMPRPVSLVAIERPAPSAAPGTESVAMTMPSPGPRPSSPAPFDEPEEPPRKPRRWPILIALAAAMLLGTAAVALRFTRSEETADKGGAKSKDLPASGAEVKGAADKADKPEKLEKAPEVPTTVPAPASASTAPPSVAATFSAPKKPGLAVPTGVAVPPAKPPPTASVPAKGKDPLGY